jgi:hypothetical protein
MTTRAEVIGIVTAFGNAMLSYVQSKLTPGCGEPQGQIAAMVIHAIRSGLHELDVAAADPPPPVEATMKEPPTCQTTRKECSHGFSVCLLCGHGTSRDASVDTNANATTEIKGSASPATGSADPSTTCAPVKTTAPPSDLDRARAAIEGLRRAHGFMCGYCQAALHTINAVLDTVPKVLDGYGLWAVICDTSLAQRRDAIERADRAERDNDTLRKRVEELEREVGRLADDLRAEQANTASLKDAGATLGRNLADAQKHWGECSNTLAAAQERARKAEGELERMTQRHGVVCELRDHITKERDDLKAELAEYEAERVVEDRNIADAVRQFTKERDDLKAELAEERRLVDKAREWLRALGDPKECNWCADVDARRKRDQERRAKGGV